MSHLILYTLFGISFNDYILLDDDGDEVFCKRLETTNTGILCYLLSVDLFRQFSTKARLPSFELPYHSAHSYLKKFLI